MYLHEVQHDMNYYVLQDLGMIVLPFALPSKGTV